MSAIIDFFNAELDAAATESSPDIKLIKELAYDLSKFAVNVVSSICGYIRQLPANKKMIGVQIMDAIINGDHPSADLYRSLFDVELVAVVVETFENIDEIMRLPLHAFRRSWQSRFPASTLEQLDRRLNVIDPAWPIASTISAKPVKSTKPAKAWRPKPKKAVDTILPEAVPQLADEKKKETFDDDVQQLIEKLTCLCLNDCL